MIKTAHLRIVNTRPGDDGVVQYYSALYPEIEELDPHVGECVSPVFYSILTKDGNAHIGICCLYNPTATEIELGVRIFIPEYWNRGYGSEAVDGLCLYAFSIYPNINTILAKTPIHNVRAMNCYMKCNFLVCNLAVMSGHKMVFMKRRR